ncbi:MULTISPECIES: FCD domain-containing protein [unclassified Meridianimarinicoccus]|uniref:FCD domain-containing protein n=1 Tax=unclassified Meridianimarinicoccus TaxID=2923344 RepID=UPI001866B4D2|nr:FCD domain-containing protein [Fluviibacterium sp. MJW13]
MSKKETSGIVQFPSEGGRASDAIVDVLQHQILSGELPHNMPLASERDLMERFAASRTVIREAVATLASRGLLDAKPRFRPIVRKPGYDTALSSVGSIVELLLEQTGGVAPLFQSRVFVERGLVRDAAVSATKGDIADLKSALRRNKDALGDSDAFYATDVAFHAVLYEIPRNPIFPTLHRAYATWLAPHWSRMLRSPERNRVNYSSHEAIYMAILERDPDVAEAELVNHLHTAWEHVRQTFDIDE